MASKSMDCNNVELKPSNVKAELNEFLWNFNELVEPEVRVPILLIRALNSMRSKISMLYLYCEQRTL